MSPLNIPNLELSALTLEEKVWLTRVMAEIVAGNDAVKSRSRKGFEQTLGSFQNREQAAHLLEALNQRPMPPWPAIKTDRQRALTLLYRLATVMAADHVVSRRQVKLFRKALSALGFSKLDHPLLLGHVQNIIVAGKPNAAILTTTDFVRITLQDFSDTHCVFSFHRPLVPGVFILVQVRALARTETYHAPIHATVRSISKGPFENGSYLIHAEFQQRLGSRHGLREFWNPALSKQDSAKGYGIVEPGDGSLIGRYVGCPACTEPGLTFWHLRTNTMHRGENLFGVPHYHASFPGYDFCDFNLLRVTVCPRCFFASAREKDFLQSPGENAHFDVHRFNRHWESQFKRLKHELHNFPQSFGKVHRKPEHAVQAYEIAVGTMRTLNRLHENEEFLWEIVRLRLIQAEMSMQLKRRDEAQKQLKDALELLKAGNSKFSDEREIQVLLSKFLLHNYFRESDAALSCYKQLRNLKPKANTGTLYSVMLQDSLKKAHWVNSHGKDLNHATMSDFHISGFTGD